MNTVRRTLVCRRRAPVAQTPGPLEVSRYRVDLILRREYSPDAPVVDVPEER